MIKGKGKVREEDWMMKAQEDEAKMETRGGSECKGGDGTGGRSREAWVWGR